VDEFTSVALTCSLSALGITGYCPAGSVVSRVQAKMFVNKGLDLLAS